MKNRSKNVIKNIIIMKRYYSPDTYCTSMACVNDLLSQRNKSSRHIQSTISLSPFQSHQTKKIGRYYYNERDQIGQGFTSKVYKAYAMKGSSQGKQEGETYAIKVISLGKATPSSMELLENEIQILKMVDHPNIIKCFDIYKSKTHCYIVTEYCPGGCLMTFIGKINPNPNKKSVTSEKVISIVQQIVQGLKYLQLKGILHRDIKPANILKGKNSWKIADFGFALKSSTQFKSKFNVGTPLYMPFESLTQNLYSPQSDIFSVGIILYEMLTGTTPWESKSQKELIKKLQLIPLQKILGKNLISPQIFKLIAKLCAFTKKNRMSKQQFSKLSIIQSIKQQSIQNPQVSISDFKKDLQSVQSETLFQRKIRQNKSLDHIQFLKEKENFLNKNRKLFTGSMIFEKSQASDVVSLQKQINSEILAPQKPKQTIEPKQHKSYGSKNQIFGQIKDRYFDIPLSLKSTNLKKNFSLNPPRFMQKGLIRQETNATQKRQENTGITQAKKSQITVTPQQTQLPQVPQVKQQISAEDELKYADQLTHIFLNQMHFCRFLFYLYKNGAYILLCKKSQEKLGVIVFKLIFENLDEISEIHNSGDDKKALITYSSQKKLDAYFRSQKCKMMKKTIAEYKQKYENEYSYYKIKLGQKPIQQIQADQRQYQELLNKSSRTLINPQEKLLKYSKKSIKQFLKQFDYNLILTIDSINTINCLSSPRHHRPNGFISANLQGLKNLYQLYRLVGILLQSNRNLELFQKKSNIKVNTDYAKKGQVTILELEKIRQLIRLL